MNSKYDETQLAPPGLPNEDGVTGSSNNASFPSLSTSNEYTMSSSSLPYIPSKLHDGESAQNFEGNGTSLSNLEKIKMVGRIDISSSEEAFGAKPRCNDVWATLLFLACLGAFIILGIVDIITHFNLDGSQRTLLQQILRSSNWFFISLGCALISLVLAPTYLILLCLFPIFIIYASLVISILIFLALAIFAFIKINIWFGILCAISVALYIPLCFIWRKRIPFAEAMIKTTGEISFDHKGTYVAAFVAFFVELILTALLFYFITFITFSYGATDAGLIILWVLSGFLFYWYSQIIKNVLHLTISGLVASVYLLSGTSKLFRRPLSRAAKNALSYSFGSVCLGSLMIAPVQTLRALVTTLAENESNFLQGCVNCILLGFEWIIRLFNQYAFTHIAIFGKSYLKAAKDTWSMFKRTDFKVVINTSIITNVILLIGILTGSACAIASGFWTHFRWTNPDIDSLRGTCVVVMAALGFLLGFTLTMIFLEVVESGVATTLVLLAENPEAVKRTKPNLYAKFEATYGQHLQSG